MFRRAGSSLIVLCCCLPAQAQPAAALLGAADCRVAHLEPLPEGPIDWNGNCKDGYAHGKGVLEWQPAGKPRQRLEGVLVQGELAGEGTLTDADGMRYIGSFRHGQPHGNGFFKYPDGSMYEGEVAYGVPEGAGVKLMPDGSRYEGGWKRGEKHGYGRASFALGGSYEGEWKQDKFDGTGTIIYAGSGRKYVGEFSDGRVKGSPPPQLANERKHFLKEDTPGSSIKTLVTGASDIPFGLGWDKMTPQHRNLVKSWYAALEDGDEPPYPLAGLEPFFRLMVEGATRLKQRSGDLYLRVKIGPDGTPLEVAVSGQASKEMRHFAGLVAMKQKYKPGVCRDRPCEMVFPYSMRFN